MNCFCISVPSDDISTLVFIKVSLESCVLRVFFFIYILPMALMVCKNAMLGRYVSVLYQCSCIAIYYYYLCIFSAQYLYEFRF